MNTRVLIINLLVLSVPMITFSILSVYYFEKMKCQEVNCWMSPPHSQYSDEIFCNITFYQENITCLYHGKCLVYGNYDRCFYDENSCFKERCFVTKWAVGFAISLMIATMALISQIMIIIHKLSLQDNEHAKLNIMRYKILTELNHVQNI